MYVSLLASATLTLWRALEHYGHDSRALFIQAGLDPDALKQPGERYDFAAVKRLWELSVEATGDPNFGLKAGQHWHPSAAHALGYAWLASDTLREAFERLVRYFHVITTDREMVRLEDIAKGYLFHWDASDALHPVSDVEYDEGFAAVIKLCRISAGDHFAPLRIQMMRSIPADPDEFAAYFRSPIEYAAPRNSILLSKDDMESALPSANIQVARQCERVIDEYLHQLDRDNVSAGVRAKLIEYLPSGSVSKEEVAAALNTSVRSMQRHLHDEGTSFKQLLDDTRRGLALQYIRDPRVSINEITYLLGYSEPANFSRAFKRWTGMSPSARRAA